jgi:uncharacterized membrane protein YecN with MAPEG domain
MENILPFLAIGLIYVAIGPAPWLAYLYFAVFVAARLAHTVSYATAQRHEVRASFYSIGSIAVVLMAVQSLLAGLGAL